MKLILLTLIILTGCKITYVTQEATITKTGSKLTFKPTGPIKPLNDTTITVVMIRKK